MASTFEEEEFLDQIQDDNGGIPFPKCLEQTLGESQTVLFVRVCVHITAHYYKWHQTSLSRKMGGDLGRLPAETHFPASAPGMLLLPP